MGLDAVPQLRQQYLTTAHTLCEIVDPIRGG
jgi:hypothetical protein